MQLLRFVVVVAMVLAASSCATVLDHQRLQDAPRALDFPRDVVDVEGLAAWWRTVADPRDSSFDVDAPVPAIETAVNGAVGITRIGFLLAKPEATTSTWRATATVAWLAATTRPPKTTGSTTTLTLWGLKLQPTAVVDEFYAADAHVIVHRLDQQAPLPAAPRIVIVDEVVIKTKTETFHGDHQYALREGRIWFKRAPGKGGTKAEPWRLFLTGVPVPFVPRAADEPLFRPAQNIVALSADGDDLVSVDDTGFVHLCTTRSTSWGSSSGWSDGWGFPGKRPLQLSGRATNPRSFAIGRRAEHALWFEDAIGNRTHMGPMGTSTFYALHENGQQILFTDNGLPNDFSRDLCGPDDGRFVADILAASASAMVVIDKHGRVLSRFEDYDLNGGTPNFEYTYRSEVRADDDPTSLFSSLKPYFLPLAPWLWHTPIALTGQARLSRLLTVFQTGVGNTARTIRVAGDDASGRRGYWTIDLDEDVWRFVVDGSVVVADSDWLDTAAVVAGAEDFVVAEGDIGRSRLPRGNSFRSSWRGTIAGLVDADGVELAPVAADIDFNPFCPPHTITLHVPSGPAVVDVVVTLHSVDMWTPAERRGSPGFDGSPLLLLGTLVFADDVLTERKPAVRRVVEGLRSYHHETFGLLIAMDRGSLTVEVVDEDRAGRHPLQMTFVQTTSPSPPPSSSGRVARGLAYFLGADVDDDIARIAAIQDTSSALASAVLLRRALQRDIDELKRPTTELEALLASPVRTLTPVLVLGRLPRIPRLLRRAIELQAPLLEQAEARWHVADGRLANLIDTLKHLQPVGDNVSF